MPKIFFSRKQRKSQPTQSCCLLCYTLVHLALLWHKRDSVSAFFLTVGCSSVWTGCDKFSMLIYAEASLHCFWSGTEFILCVYVYVFWNLSCSPIYSRFMFLPLSWCILHFDHALDGFNLYSYTDFVGNTRSTCCSSSTLHQTPLSHTNLCQMLSNAPVSFVNANASR